MTDSNVVNNQVVAQASSQFISIVPENGEQFNPRQKIIFNIMPEIGFIKNDSYIVFDVLNSSSDASRATLQKNLGAHALIERVDIFSKETGILLESNTHYREWCNVEHQYYHDSWNNKINHEGVGEPVQSWTHDVSASNVVTSKRSVPDAKNIANNQLSPLQRDVERDGTNHTAVGGKPAYMTRRFCIPLKCGIFGAYDMEEKAIPVMNFGGLRIEITLAEPKEVLQRLGCVRKNLSLNNNQKDEVVDLVAGLSVAGADVATDFSATTLKIICQGDDGNIAYNGLDNIQRAGLCVGNKINFSGKNTANADFSVDTVITKVHNNPTGANGGETLDPAIIIDGDLKGSLFKQLVIETSLVNAGPVGYKAGAIVKVKNDDLNYKVNGVELRLLQVVPPPNVADSLMKGIDYEFTGYEVFFDNIPTATLRHQIPIHSVASKALAIFTQLYGSSNADGISAGAMDKLVGILPKDSKVNDIVFFINNRLYPLRSYNPQKNADRVLCLNELVKSFRAIGKQPLNLGSVDFDDMEDYTNTPLIARELARNGMVFDLRNAEPELRLAFSSSRTEILRANTFVFSKKIIQTTATGLQVIH